MNELFSSFDTCGKIFTSEFNEEDTKDMVLYSYVDKQMALQLFNFYTGLKCNVTSTYRSKNPIQVPLTLYESKENAKILATPTNNQLVAFSVKTGSAAVYDELNLGIRLEIKAANKTVDQYKESAVLWREKKKYRNLDYIAYTVRNKNIITDIQLQD